MRKPLTYNGKLRTVNELVKILGKNRICGLGLDVHKRPTAKQAAELNKAQEEMPFASDITDVDGIELQEIARNASKSIENLNQQLEAEGKNLLMREVLGLNRELERIRGRLKVAVAKKLDLEEEIEKQKGKLAEIETPIKYGDYPREEIRNKIERLNDEP